MSSIKQLDTLLHSSLVKTKNGFYQIKIHDTGRIEYDSCNSKGDTHSSVDDTEYCDPAFASFLASFIGGTYEKQSAEKHELEKQLKAAKKKDVL